MQQGNLRRPPRQVLDDLYTQQRRTARQIAVIYGVTGTSVKRWLRYYDIPRRPARGLANRGVIPPTAADLQRMVHEEHRSYAEIALLYGVDHSAVPHWLKKHGIRQPTIWESRRRGKVITLPGANDLRAMYEGGRSLKSIGAEHGVSGGLISKLCQRHGIPVRSPGWAGGQVWQCSDGHQVRSTYEQRVDNWLSSHSISHEVSPRLPFDRRYRSDFRAGSLYVEVWGVEGVDSYNVRRQRKVERYAASGLTLVQIHYSQFPEAGSDEWQTILVQALLKRIGEGFQRCDKIA